MAKKEMNAIGIEFDSQSIRAARLTPDKKDGTFQLDEGKVQEIRGDMLKDEVLADSLNKIKDSMEITHRDKVTTCIFGKQVYAAQLTFPKLPEAEMMNALKFEVRKKITFSMNNALLDYHVLDNEKTKDKKSQTLLVTVVSNALLDKQLGVLDKVRIKPWIVDVLPLAISNAFWAGVSEKEQDVAYVMIHISTDVCTIVVDGNGVPFYTRSIYFSQEELYKELSSKRSMQGKGIQEKSLGNELRRSLSFYENTYNAPNFGRLYLIGDYEESPEFYEIINEGVGLKMKNKLFEKKDAKPGKYDVALALAMRTQ
jgi:type IV pilus assembly protein PilM